MRGGAGRFGAALLCDVGIFRGATSACVRAVRAVRAENLSDTQS